MSEHLSRILVLPGDDIHIRADFRSLLPAGQELIQYNAIGQPLAVQGTSRRSMMTSARTNNPTARRSGTMNDGGCKSSNRFHRHSSREFPPAVAAADTLPNQESAETTSPGPVDGEKYRRPGRFPAPRPAPGSGDHPGQNASGPRSRAEISSSAIDPDVVTRCRRRPGIDERPTCVADREPTRVAPRPSCTSRTA